MGIKLTAVIVLGASPLSVLVFEILLNAASMFNHSNIFIPLGLDRVIRLMIVTPDMHRVHHSVIIKETNSNYGFTLPWWDRFFGTYWAQPAKGHRDMLIGNALFLDGRKQKLNWLLLLPFLKEVRNSDENELSTRRIAGTGCHLVLQKIARSNYEYHCFGTAFAYQKNSTKVISYYRRFRYSTKMIRIK